MAHNLKRQIFTFALAVICLACMAVPAFASSADTTSAITDMNSKIYRIYLLVRNNIAFPLLALSFASCGFKILGAGFIGSGAGSDRSIQSAKEQIVTSVSALLLILALPYLISYGKQLFKSTAWTPDTILILALLKGGMLP